jgi:DNA-binding XRE family transcriptional regulator
MSTGTNEVKALKTLREESKHSQESLAAALGVSRQMIYLYERGEKNPTFEKAVTMARLLNVPLKVLARSFGYDTAGIPDDRPE